MKSPQEALLRYISKHSIGYEYVFEPDEYAKGNAKREPADLVWACNNCIMLMYMAQRKHKTRKPEAHAFVRQEMIKHNLSQAKGWLSEWRNNGRKLTGKNSHRNFDIVHDEFKYIIVISVIDCGDALGECHITHEANLNVTFCVTLPQQTLVELALMGGGIMDILIIIELMKLYQKDFPSKLGYGFDMSPILSVIQTKAFEKAGITLSNSRLSHNSLIKLTDYNVSNGFPIDARMNEVYNMLRRLRSPSKNVLKSMNLQERWSVSEMLNDMPLEDLYSLALTLHSLIASCGPNHERHGCASIIIDIYYVSICAVAMGKTDFTKLVMPTQGDFTNKFTADENARGMFLILWDTIFDQEIMIATFDVRTHKTLTERKIEAIISRLTT